MEELIEKLRELQKELEAKNLDIGRIKDRSDTNAAATIAVLKEYGDKSLVEAYSNVLRSYDDALAKCIEAGAEEDDDFIHKFTIHYVNTLLAIIANLLLMDEITGDKKNIAFIKSKIKESLLYIDKL